MSKSNARVFLAADHGGWFAMEKLRRNLISTHSRHHVMVLTPVRRSGDDFPLIAQRLARAVRQRVGCFGIGFCRSGVGLTIAANKFTGIRAVQGWSEEIARRSRKEENANIIVFAADFQTARSIQRICEKFLRTSFDPRRRYNRRLRQIASYEA